MRRRFPQQPMVGVGVVAVAGGRVLLVERATPPLAGYWSVPGGLVELGETAREAAAREAMEETGIAVEIGAVAAVIDRIERTAAGEVEYHYVLIDFMAAPTGGAGGAAVPVAGSDAGQAAWVEWEDLPRYRLTPGLEEILLRARRTGGE